ncbi:MAG: hypothetical protein JWP63_521 [Candidatus Solibacter sp.]|nr:hypothetical protein [Candidatus Solibacter sp.]
MLRWTLREKPEQIARILGRPDHVDDSVKAYQSWQYESADNEDRDDNSPPSYILCLRNPDQQLLSVTRNFAAPQDVDDLFPPKETRTYHWPNTHAPQFSVRLRPISSETLLIGMGTSRPGERTTQLVLIRRSALKTFMPWLDRQFEE